MTKLTNLFRCYAMRMGIKCISCAFIYPNALLLFRTGDNYTCYEEDAMTAAAVLELTDIYGTPDKISVARFPHHCIDSCLPRLIRAGHRIAICDQLESPKQREQNQACLNSAESRRTGSKAEAPKPKKQAQQELFLRS